VNNTVCAQSGQQNISNPALFKHCITTDGAGGVIVTWQDTRNNKAIYAQRLDNNGNIKWNSAGVAIATLPTNTWNVLNPCIVSDGVGGAIIVWQRNVSGTKDTLYAQRIDADGNEKWTSGGIFVCANANTNDYPVVCTDGNSGAFVAWINHIPYNTTIYAQRIDSNGTAQWVTNGIAIRAGGSYTNYPQICSDGVGGAYIGWSDGGDTKIYVQRVSSTGDLKWSAPGVAASGSSPVSVDIPRICVDEHSGVIATWAQEIAYDNLWNIYSQRIDSNGVVQWTAGGVQMCSLKSLDANITSDGNGGVIAAWSDYRAGTGWWTIYAQHITSAGSVDWTANGIPVTTVAKMGSAQYSAVTSNGNGGAIIGWLDSRSGTSLLYAQSVSSSGSLEWSAYDVTVTNNTSGGGQYNPQVIPAGTAGEGIFVWEDTRASGATNLYASKIFSNGALPVELQQFKAVVRSQGIELQWHTATEMNNAGWEIQKMQESNAANSLKMPWEKVGYVNGSGTTNAPHSYSFIDEDARGSAAYRLKQIDRSGAFSYSQEIETTIAALPGAFQLFQNNPNPFNPSTSIRFVVPVTEKAVLKIYSAAGEEIATLFDGNVTKDAVTAVAFDGSNLSSGVYFCRLTAGGFQSVKRMVLLK
jgi:hypothetical protein